MWLVDLTFLQESANIFEEYFVKKNYKIYTCSGKVFLVINEIKNYPHLIGIRRQILSRLRGSEFLFNCIKNNDTTQWTTSMKRTFYGVYHGGLPFGLNDIKITFFPLMIELFVKDNYIISVNYDKNNATTSGAFDTEVLISDFNEGMNIGMKQRLDSSFGFNSWRVEQNEQEIMNMYSAQEIDLIEKIEQYENGTLLFSNSLNLNKKNYWRLSRLMKNYSSTFLPSSHHEKIVSLSKYEDSDFTNAMNIEFDSSEV